MNFKATLLAIGFIAPLVMFGMVSCGGGNDVASSGASAVSAAATAPDASNSIIQSTATAATPTTAPKVNDQVDDRTGVAPVLAGYTVPGIGITIPNICDIAGASIKDKANGASCLAHCQCISNNCIADGVIGGKCAPEKGADGDVCVLNKDCASDYCQGNTGGIPLEWKANSGSGKCVPYKAANGEGCWINDHCKSDYCLANTSGLRYGQCGDRYNNPKGYQCTLGSQCASGTCKGNGIVGGLPGICG